MTKFGSATLLNVFSFFAILTSCPRTDASPSTAFACNPKDKHPDVVTFCEYLKKLDVTKKESGTAARRRFSELFSEKKRNWEESFRLFRRFYGDVTRSCNNPFFQKRTLQQLLNKIAKVVGYHLSDSFPTLGNTNDAKILALKPKHKDSFMELVDYQEAGFGFYYAEGDWYLDENPDFFVDMLSDFPGELKEYISFYAQEHKQRVAHDAGLVISWDDLRKRMIRWEDFTKKHSELKEARQDARQEFKKLASIYLFGLDNTQAYDLLNTGRIDSDLKRSYETFLQSNRGSSLFRVIQGVYGTLKKNGFIASTELLTFLSKKGWRDVVLERRLKQFESSQKKARGGD